MKLCVNGWVIFGWSHPVGRDLAVFFARRKDRAWPGPINERELAQWAMFCDRCGRWPVRMRWPSSFPIISALHRCFCPIYVRGWFHRNGDHLLWPEPDHNCRIITATGAALLENNEASTKLTTANGGTFISSSARLRSQSRYSTLDQWLTCFNVIGYWDWQSSK